MYERDDKKKEQINIQRKEKKKIGKPKAKKISWAKQYFIFLNLLFFFFGTAERSRNNTKWAIDGFFISFFFPLL